MLLLWTWVVPRWWWRWRFVWWIIHIFVWIVHDGVFWNWIKSRWRYQSVVVWWLCEHRFVWHCIPDCVHLLFTDSQELHPVL